MNQYLLKITYEPEPDSGATPFTRYRITESAQEVVDRIGAGYEAFLIIENGNATALRPISLLTAQEPRDVVTLNDGVGVVETVVK